MEPLTGEDARSLIEDLEKPDRGQEKRRKALEILIRAAGEAEPPMIKHIPSEIDELRARVEELEVENGKLKQAIAEILNHVEYGDTWTSDKYKEMIQGRDKHEKEQ